jgi:hypothetical protein
MLKALFMDSTDPLIEFLIFFFLNMADNCPHEIEIGIYILYRVIKDYEHTINF